MLLRTAKYSPQGLIISSNTLARGKVSLATILGHDLRVFDVGTLGNPLGEPSRIPTLPTT